MRFGWLRRALEHDGLAVSVLAFWTILLALGMPFLINQDSWLAFVDGRLIAHDGLPHTDTLTLWTLGRHWIDQQWAAHLVLYEAVARGGLRAAIVLGIGCVTAALGVAAYAARRLGASPGSVALGISVPVLATPWLAQVRSQSFALVPFVAVYALLAADSRRPGRRVLFALPILAVWANFHGSVSLGAGLTALYGLSLLRAPAARLRGLVLLVGAPLCVLASPYGLGLVSYYRLMLLRPPLAHYVPEWQPPGVQGATMLFFASALVAVGLWGAHRRTLTTFERWAIPLLLVAALAALRNGIWFEWPPPSRCRDCSTRPGRRGSSRARRAGASTRSSRRSRCSPSGSCSSCRSRGADMARERPLARRSCRSRGRRRERRRRARRRRARRLAPLAAAVTRRADRLRRPVRAVRRSRAPAAEAARGCVAPGLAALRVAGARRHVRRPGRREGRAA